MWILCSASTTTARKYTLTELFYLVKSYQDCKDDTSFAKEVYRMQQRLFKASAEILLFTTCNRSKSNWQNQCVKQEDLYCSTTQQSH